MSKKLHHHQILVIFILLRTYIRQIINQWNKHKSTQNTELEETITLTHVKITLIFSRHHKIITNRLQQDLRG